VPLADDRLTAETVDLLQVLIRNRCVNDGTPTSGNEVRSADTLAAFLEPTGVDLETYEPLPGRRSLVARLEGTDPTAPTICLMGHTDVVPANADAWRHDPFGGELIDDEVWGRGAIDMLNLTASMAVALRALATDPSFRPRGTLVYLAVADEEAGGALGAEWVTANVWDAVACDVALTESGGLLTHTPAGPRVVINTAEKGIAWRRLTVRGTPGHGSRPFGADNAIVKAAEVVRRLSVHRPNGTIGEHWQAYVRAMALPAEREAELLDPRRVLDGIERLPDPNLRAYCHALTHTTYSPNIIQGGTKTNIIPDEVVIEVDVRTLPGTTGEDVDAELAVLLGDLADHVTWEPGLTERSGSASTTGTAVWDELARLAREAHPEAEVLPAMSVGGTDAAFFRARGVPAYGAGLFSARASLEEFSARFHGHDERVDVESLGLSTAMWVELARRTL
jgi:acetylornithine deacetylase/succinyl-diaminopimelate desuccinylase-like protein